MSMETMGLCDGVGRRLEGNSTRERVPSLLRVGDKGSAGEI